MRASRTEKQRGMKMTRQATCAMMVTCCLVKHVQRVCQQEDGPIMFLHAVRVSETPKCFCKISLRFVLLKTAFKRL